MSSSLPRVARFCVPLLLATILSACAAHDHAALDRRLAELERRSAELEAPKTVDAPQQSREELEAQIKSLEHQRAQLLLRYTEKHPSVKVIDQRLEDLNAQLRMLE